MKIKILKFKNDLIVPIRAHYNDAGIDCYAQEDFELGSIGAKTIDEDGVCCPIDKISIPLGFGLEVPNGYMATIRPRSSMNKKGILTQLGTVDSGYRGEIQAMFVNLTNNNYSFKKGDKICQIIIEPVVLADFVEELGTERGVGGFGSTGK